ncbi:MAG: hypothetical protein WD226_11905 [Planctomycetota bacterium]
MTRGEAYLSHLASLLVGGTGLVYAWMRYFAEPVDEFALVNHPLEPEVQAAHILLAPLLVLSLGAIWRTHVLGKLRANRRGRRRTGWALALVAFPMIASGYLLQVAGSETWRTVWIWLHVGTSIVWILAYLAHQRADRFAR